MKKSVLVLALSMVLLVLGASSAFAQNAYETIPASTASELNSDSGKFSDGSGPRIEANDAKNIGYIVAGNWAKFSGIEFGDPGATKVKIEAATANAAGTVDVFLDKADGTKIATINYNSTGDWQKYEWASADVSGVTGTHDVVFVFTSGDINVRSVGFEGDAGAGGAAAPANPATGDAGIGLYVALAAAAAAGFVFLSRKKFVKQ